jgi:hypothetical protein
MSREAQFGKKLDQVLAGQPFEAEGEDAELLVFAGRLRGLKRAPSLEFKTRLKADLLRKLDPQVVHGTGRGWLWQLVSRPMTQAALILMVILIAGTTMWATGVFNPPATPVPTVLKAAAGTNKTVYLPGEPVLITVLTMAEFPPIVSLMRAADKQAAYTFQSGSSIKVIEPAQTATFSLSWDQQGDSGQQVSPGRYYIELEDLYYQGVAVKLNLDKPVEFSIN